MVPVTNMRYGDASPPPLLRQSWVEQQYPAGRPSPQYPHRASIPRAIFQGSHCSNDTSLRTEHMPPMPEQVVLSHAECARHVVTYLPPHPNRPQSLQILNLVGIQTLQPYLVKTFVDLKKKKK